MTDSKYLTQKYMDDIDKKGFGEDAGLKNIIDTV